MVGAAAALALTLSGCPPDQLTSVNGPRIYVRCAICLGDGPDGEPCNVYETGDTLLEGEIQGYVLELRRPQGLQEAGAAGRPGAVPPGVEQLYTFPCNVQGFQVQCTLFRK